MAFPLTQYHLISTDIFFGMRYPRNFDKTSWFWVYIFFVGAGCRPLPAGAGQTARLDSAGCRPVLLAGRCRCRAYVAGTCPLPDAGRCGWPAGDPLVCHLIDVIGWLTYIYIYIYWSKTYLSLFLFSKSNLPWYLSLNYSYLFKMSSNYLR